ncbi:MAG: molybdopterin cofactor-binding domain-containing protein [Ilumatobacteraceae bacterium]
MRWTEERSENSMATIHGRGQIQDIELAADADGKLIGLRVELLADMGAYLQLVTPGIPLLGAFLYAGVYHLPKAFSFSCTCRVHQPHPDRRLPRRRATRGDVRDRTGDGHPRRRRRCRPARDPTPQLHPH